MPESKSSSAMTKEALRRENQALRREIEEIQKLQEERDKRKDRENKKKYYSLFNNIADPVFIFDATTYKYLDCNEAVIKKYGYTREEILAMTPFDLHTTEEFQKLRKSIDARSAGGTHMYTHLTKDRRQLTMEVSYTEIYFEGSPAWLCVAHDITERVNMEEELHRYRHRLEEMVDERTTEVLIANRKLEQEIRERKKAQLGIQDSEKKIRNIIEKSLDGIMLIDETGIIIEWNHSQENIFGSKYGMVVGKTIWEVQHLYEPTDKKGDGSFEKIKKLWQAFFKTGINPFKNELRVAQIKRPDGKRRNIEQLYFPIETDKGFMMACTTRDITDQLVMEKQLSQTQKMEAIGTLAGGIAHDFNNILGAIMGYSELAKRKLEDDSPLYRYMDQVVTATLRASDLVKQILTFSRQDKKVKEPVRISLIVKEVLKLIRSSLPATIDIVSKIEADKSIVLADPTQIHQVIMNLCTNAAYAMKDRGGTLEVKMVEETVEPGLYRGLKAGPCVRITVSDTGSGIKPETLDKIFDPFFTTKKRDEGTGMGLAVVHGIVKDLEGNISVYSEVDKGTTFSILLPRVIDKIIKKEKVYGKIPGGNERILVVEDDLPFAEAEKEMLEELGYQVTAVRSGVEAWEIVQKVPDRFNLIITDHTMPRMTGVQLIENIRLKEWDIPIILCTGYHEVLSEEDAKALKVGDIIYKPIDLYKIARSIRQLIDKNKKKKKD